MRLGTVEGATFDCHGCGDCCRHFAVGPVRPSTVQGLVELGAADLVPDLDGPFFEERPGEDGPELFFTQRDDACVFLDEQSRCRIHAAYGPEAKPWLCRAFPFALIAAPDGVRLGVRPECGGLHNGATTELSAYSEEVLRDADHYPPRGVMPDGIDLPGGVAFPPSAYLKVEEAMLAAISRAETMQGALDGLRSVLDRLLTAVGAPVAERSEASAGQQAFARLVAAIRPPDTATDVFSERLRTVLDAPPAAYELEPVAEALLSEALKQHVHSGAVTVHGGLAAGLGSFLLGARLSCNAAATTPGVPVTAPDLNHSWVTYWKAVGWRDPHGRLRDHRDALETFFLARAEPTEAT